MTTKEAYSGKRKLSGRYTIIKCVCPGCGEIRKGCLEVEFIKGKDSWKRACYFVVLCSNCRIKKGVKMDSRLIYCRECHTSNSWVKNPAGDVVGE